MTPAQELRQITDFNDLLPFLKNRMGWPIDEDWLKEDDPIKEVTFEFKLHELGIDPNKAPNIRGIGQLQPFYQHQPFGIFLVSFEDKSLPITAMRRVLRALVKHKRTTAEDAERQRWGIHDLMFISNFGESGQRKLSFAHFHDDPDTDSRPILRVIGWDDDDTPTRIKLTAEELTTHLRYPNNPADIKSWRRQWQDAFSRTPGQTIATTKALTKHLAHFATNVREAIIEVMSLEEVDGPLHKILDQFSCAIFPDLDGDSFADMYAQTVSYGLLQAKLSRTSPDETDRSDAASLVLDDAASLMVNTNPFLHTLFETFLSVGQHQTDIDFDEIGLSDIRDLLQNTDMNEVLADFYHKNPNQNPAIHLYEFFLRDYDEIKRVSRGVFYTPKEVVGFIIRSVHETLQNEFGLADGLADTTSWAQFARHHDNITIPNGWADRPFVNILDPATGTGTFLIETIDLIHGHMMDKWRAEGKSEAECKKLWQDYVPKNLLPRLHGFEVMMASYAMAHLGIALKLHETGYSHDDTAPRVQIYLTNTLAAPFHVPGTQGELGFLEQTLAEEGKGANHIKRDVPITIIIGNPPYAAASMNPSRDKKGRLTWVGDLIRPYFDVDGQPLGERNPKLLNDDYVKFIRYGEYRLERSGAGILGYITNHAFLDNVTFRGMRQHLIGGASSLSVLDLHGNSKRKETSPDGSKDVNVFDIQTGVAISILAHIGQGNGIVKKGDLYGPRGAKLNHLAALSMAKIQTSEIKPYLPFYLFLERDNPFEAEYSAFLSVQDIMPLHSIGVKTHRDHFVIDMDEAVLTKRIQAFFDESLTDAEIRERFRLKDNSEWQISKCRRKNLFKPDAIKDICYRPFDWQKIYYSSSLIDRPKKEVMQNMLDGDNLGLVTVRQVAEGIFNHCIVSDKIIESRMTLSNRGAGFLFPLKLLPDGKLYQHVRPNIAPDFLRSMQGATGLSFQPLLGKPATPPPHLDQRAPITAPLIERGELTTCFGCRDLFDYIYAVLHSPAYRTRYAEFLKYDFPRIPLPGSPGLFTALIPLGAELIQLHLLDKTHPKLARPAIVFRGAGDNRLGKAAAIKWHNGRVPINATQWFEDVPLDSFEFKIGGYQPLEKWLKDRAAKGGKSPAPGRMLTDHDTLHYRRITTAITQTRQIMTQIDETIETQGGWPTAFKG